MKLVEFDKRKLDSVTPGDDKSPAIPQGYSCSIDNCGSLWSENCGRVSSFCGGQTCTNNSCSGHACPGHTCNGTFN